MSKYLRTTGTILAMVMCIASSSGQGLESKKISELMRAKLKYSQKILEGLALGDFDKIADNAEELLQISKNLEWQVDKSPRFEVHSNEFRRTAEGTIQKAREKNLDGATLSYVEMTLACVKCHKHVRDKRMTMLEGDETAPKTLTIGTQPPR
jgi:hypothetical protein